MKAKPTALALCVTAIVLVTSAAVSLAAAKWQSGPYVGAASQSNAKHPYIARLSFTATRHKLRHFRTSIGDGSCGAGAYGVNEPSIPVKSSGKFSASSVQLGKSAIFAPPSTAKITGTIHGKRAVGTIKVVKGCTQYRESFTATLTKTQ